MISTERNIRINVGAQNVENNNSYIAPIDGHVRPNVLDRPTGRTVSQQVDVSVGNPRIHRTTIRVMQVTRRYDSFYYFSLPAVVLRNAKTNSVATIFASSDLPSVSG